MRFKIERFFERKLERVKKYYPVVLSLGIALVFLWFGFSQLKNPAAWTRMMPEYAQAIIPIGANNLIYLNGIVEIVLAVLLLLGLFTRTTSLLLTLHLLHIITILGYGAVAARDLALAVATFAVFLHGADEFCLDKILPTKKEKQKEEKSVEESKEG